MLNSHLLEELAPLKLNLARLKCVALLLGGLLRHRTVNLTLLSTGNLSGAANESCYRRFQRLFLQCPLASTAIGRLILTKIPRPQRGWVLSMDREFGGRKWLQWPDKQSIGYVVRIKANTIVGNKLATQHRSTREGKKATTRQKIWDMELFFVTKTITSKGRRDHRLHLISNRFHGAEALELYKLRWGIEQLFSHLKKRGFNLEDTHMTAAAKLEKLFALVTLAFVFSFAWGCHLRTTRKVTKAIARKSLFRWDMGLSWQ